MDSNMESGLSAFESFAAGVRDAYKAVGLAVCVFDERDTLYQRFWGYRDLEKKLPIDEGTIFGVASITKSFTSASIMQLAEAGAVSLDAPVSQYIPEFRNLNRGEPVRVRHLMSHCAGYYPLPRLLAEDVAREMGIWDEKRDLAFDVRLAEKGAALVAGRLDSQTGHTGRVDERMSYSNDGYGLLSEIIRRRGGSATYSDYVREHILGPLGMDRSCGEFLRPLADPDRAALYKVCGGELRGGFDYYDNAFVLMGGGVMKSTLRDMRRYVRMYMRGGDPVLSDYSVREMIKPRQEYRFHQFYGYGISARYGAVTVYGHGGSLTGVSSNFAWSPELKLGVLVFSNTSGVPVSAVSAAAMRLFGGLPASAEEPKPRAAAWTAKMAADACGTYRSGEGDCVSVSCGGGELGVKVGDRDAVFRAAAPDVLMISAPFSEADMIFLRDDDGKVYAVRFKGRIIPRAD